MIGMAKTRKRSRGLTAAQAGGRWLAEGADGCVFTAPHNWPCQSPSDLSAYDPEDPTVVTKIVATDDFEENILALLPFFRKKYKLQNLPEYIGTCTPRTTRFIKRTNKTVNLFAYFQNLNRQGKTRKGCKAWAQNFAAGRRRKLYVLRKYIMTFAEYRKEQNNPALATLLAQQARLFHHTLSVLATGTPYQILHYDLHSKNIVLFPKGNKPFDPADGSTFEIGPADFGRALWRDVRKPVNPATWDNPYYDQFLSRVHSGRYSEFSQFSLENRLFSYIASHLNEKGVHPQRSWLERWATDDAVLAAIPKAQDPLYWALPTLLSVFPRSRQWQQFEATLERLVRLLMHGTDESRAAALRNHPPLRRFFDKIKARSMFPVAYGLFLRGALECCGLSKETVAIAMRSPTEESLRLVPKPLRAAFGPYWRGLLTVVS